MVETQGCPIDNPCGICNGCYIAQNFIKNIETAGILSNDMMLKFTELWNKAITTNKIDINMELFFSDCTDNFQDDLCERMICIWQNTVNMYFNGL